MAYTEAQIIEINRKRGVVLGKAARFAERMVVLVAALKILGVW